MDEIPPSIPEDGGGVLTEFWGLIDEAEDWRVLEAIGFGCAGCLVDGDEYGLAMLFR